MSSAKKILIF